MLVLSRALAASALAVCAAASGGASTLLSGGGRKLQIASACTLGSNCAEGTITLASLQGICVLTQTGNACWDVCDPTKPVSAYTVAAGDTQLDNNTQLKLLVSQIRDGKNLNVQCPTSFESTSDWCPPGNRCGGVVVNQTFGTGSSAHARSLPQNAGMCVVDASGPDGRKCLDMCNEGYKEEAFTMGTPEGTWAEVQSVRAGTDGKYSCPRFNVWPWIVGILLCCILAILLGMAYVRFGHKLKRRSAGPAPRGMDTYEVQQDAMMDRGMEPEPPQMMERQMEAEAPMTQQLPVTQPQVEGSQEWRGGPIPGMDEPHLAMPMQPLNAASSQAQVATPDLLAQAQPAYFTTAPSQPAVQLTATPSQAYRTAMPMVTTASPTYLSQPAVLSPTYASQGQAFATQPLLGVSQPGSMTVSQQGYYR